MAKKSRANSASTNPVQKPASSTPASTGRSIPAANTTPQQTREQRRARRPEAIQQNKTDRFKNYQKQKQQALLVKIGFGVLAVLVVLGASWWGYGQWQQYKVSDDVTTYFSASDFSGQHVTGDVLYEEVPPVGGPHNAVWQNCGYYSQYINNVNGVHSLEHGAVWITYDPDLPDDQIQKLKDKTKQTYVLVSPYPGLPTPVVASVWGKQIKLDSASDSRLDAFISKYRQNRGNTPEPGALCTLGTSATTATPPQTTPYERVSGTVPVGGVTIADATATAAAQSPVSTPGSPVSGPAVAPTTVGPIMNGTPSASSSPAAGGTPPPVVPVPGSPVASPAATPAASPESTPAAP